MAEPLGRITILRSYCNRTHGEKATKTERPRLVPAHPTLAAILAEWRLARRPRPDDLVVPGPDGGHRNVNSAARQFKRDLRVLGLRERRHYDSRRTFVSAALGDGARKDLLRWITHAPGDVFDGYTSPPWTALCEAVACLKVERLGGEVLRLAGSRGGTGPGAGGGVA